MEITAIRHNVFGVANELSGVHGMRHVLQSMTMYKDISLVQCKIQEITKWSDEKGRVLTRKEGNQCL